MQSIERYLGIELEPRTVTGLESRFKGPSKKSATAAKKKADIKPKPKTKVIPKAQQRHSYKKNIGKRRVPKDETGKDGVQEISPKISVASVHSPIRESVTSKPVSPSGKPRRETQSKVKTASESGPVSGQSNKRPVYGKPGGPATQKADGKKAGAVAKPRARANSMGPLEGKGMAPLKRKS